MSEGLVDAVDDLPHAVGPEQDFSESLYYEFGDGPTGLVGFLRLANRPNEGRGECTVCLFLPDGRVALSFGRPRFDDDRVFDAGGMSVTVVQPLLHHRVSFVGEVSLLADPRAMDDPRSALATSPRAACRIELEVHAATGAVPFTLDDEGDFVPHHYDQFVTVRGSVDVDGQVLDCHGHGMRDHSWGRRSWQAPPYYRWLFGACADVAFAAGVLGRGAGHRRAGGFLWEGDVLHVLDEVVVRTDWVADRIGRVRVELSAADRSWTVEGRALNAVPLRSRPRSGEGMTRILETAVEWSMGGSRLLGIAEYLDQVSDGEAVGVTEYDRPVAQETRART
jgi:hypothetical protein